MCSPNSENANGYERIDQYNEESTKKLSEHYENILRIIGEDPGREGLNKTPE